MIAVTFIMIALSAPVTTPTLQQGALTTWSAMAIYDPAPRRGTCRTTVRSTCACINLAATTPRNSCRRPQIIIDAKHLPSREARRARGAKGERREAPSTPGAMDRVSDGKIVLTSRLSSMLLGKRDPHGLVVPRSDRHLHLANSAPLDRGDTQLIRPRSKEMMTQGRVSEGKIPGEDLSGTIGNHRQPTQRALFPDVTSEDGLHNDFFFWRADDDGLLKGVNALMTHLNFMLSKRYLDATRRPPVALPINKKRRATNHRRLDDDRARLFFQMNRKDLLWTSLHKMSTPRGLVPLLDEMHEDPLAGVSAESKGRLSKTVPALIEDRSSAGKRSQKDLHRGRRSLLRRHRFLG